MEQMKNTIQSITEKFDKNIKVIGGGAESVTFNLEYKDSEKRKKIVLKADKEYIGHLCFSLLDDFNDYSFNTSEVIEEYKEKIRFNKNLEKELVNIFGDSLQKTKIFEKELKVTSDIVWSVLKNYYPNGNDILERKIKEQNINIILPILFEVQNKSKELLDKEKYNIKSISIGLVTEESLVDVDDDKKKEIIDEKVEKQIKNYYNNLDDKVKLVYKEFILNLIKYTKKTGYILDIFGPDNFFIYKDDFDSFKLKITDPILPAYNKKSKLSINNDIERKYFRHNYTYYSFLKKNIEILNLDEELELDFLNYFKKEFGD